MPMTPRSVVGYNASNEFARQVAEHGRERDGQPPTKKFRSSLAPKGSKLATGYQDRTLARREDEDGPSTQDDKEKRFKALEEMYKLQQIDEATFESLKHEIGIGGSLETTHLIKGLDWKLLQRARLGEDLNATAALSKDDEQETSKIDVDDELDDALQRDVEARASASTKDSESKQIEQQSQTVSVTRDEILRRLKESRGGKQAAKPMPESALGDKFKKVSSEKKSNKKKFVESINGRRREVLIITNKDGTTKRKTRWLDKEGVVSTPKETAPLGMEVPLEFQLKQKALLEQQAAAEQEEANDDIFGGVADYDPLAGLNSDGEESDADAHAAIEGANAAKTTGSEAERKPRNYFNADQQPGDAEDRANPITKDPTLFAALKRAAGLRQNEESGKDDQGDPDQEAKQKQFLARLKERDRADAADMDLGFGESRFGDEDDDDGEIWDGEETEAKKPARKRGAKKRKGDKDSVNDVMSVLEGRKKEKS